MNRGASLSDILKNLIQKSSYIWHSLTWSAVHKVISYHFECRILLKVLQICGTPHMWNKYCDRDDPLHDGWHLVSWNLRCNHHIYNQRVTKVFSGISHDLFNQFVCADTYLGFDVSSNKEHDKITIETSHIKISINDMMRCLPYCDLKHSLFQLIFKNCVSNKHGTSINKEVPCHL